MGSAITDEAKNKAEISIRIAEQNKIIREDEKHPEKSENNNVLSNESVEDLIVQFF